MYVENIYPQKIIKKVSLLGILKLMDLKEHTIMKIFFQFIEILLHTIMQS